MYHSIHVKLARAVIILVMVALSVYAVSLAVSETGVLRVREVPAARR